MTDAVVEVILVAAVICCMKPNMAAMSSVRLLSVRRSILKSPRRIHGHGSDTSTLQSPQKVSFQVAGADGGRYTLHTCI